ncbi:PREDICTED: disease resistance protein TAO1-like [Camelina sativa]|uniref:Disease resistance protein TAO1-like n=1 Tax=Camelina sativa TaxID=90675 RepID=A0ABM0X5H2_CAMSA|nr:PREDICTED: disease resistance protein TAO1-like [Camelina sativa]
MALSPTPSTGSDVFVSFRGEEIRRVFVSHIYRSLEQKGIRTFKGETELNLEPSEIHLAAIRASKVAIVVVSKNYVSSPSVLRELEEILNYLRNGYLTVFPVYYGVDDSDVKRQAEEVCTDQVELSATAWRNALMELACISGEQSNNWHCLDREDDAELILKITNDIWDKLTSSRFRGLVGMDLRMRRLYELLCLDAKYDEVREIGIWGRASLGKRTLAKIVYQEISHSFDVSFQASGSLHMISPDDTAWLTDQRVLLVLVGVDIIEKLDILREYIKLFGPGSRVIVTCLDKKLLLACGVTLLYQVESLEFYEALELLNLHAFKDIAPLEGYEQFLARAIKIGNGYPSVIAAVGSELCAKPKEEWETILSRYEQSSDECTTGTERSSSDASVGSR